MAADETFNCCAMLDGVAVPESSFKEPTPGKFAAVGAVKVPLEEGVRPVVAAKLIPVPPAFGFNPTPA